MTAKTTTAEDRRCWGSGQPVTLSVAEQAAAEARCCDCGRVLRLRRDQSGFAAETATLPRHNRTASR